MVRDSKPESRELKRGFTFDRESIDVENRRVSLAFSSELPYERHFGMEVLGHERGEVNLSRLGDGTHPLLLNHDRNKQIGVIEKAGIEGDRVGRAIARFSKSQLGEEIFQDVLDGIRSQASVAYEVSDWKITKNENKTETWRATKWTPFEVSIVSIAADPSVGIGKEHTIQNNTREEAKNMTPEEQAALERQRKFEEEQRIEAAVKKANDEAKAKLESEKILERTRVSEISAIGRMHNMAEEAEKAIADGTSLLDFRGVALQKINKVPPTAIAVTQPMVRTHKSIGEMFVERAMEDLKHYKNGKRINIRVELDAFNKFERATLSTSGLTSVTDLPGLVVPDRRVLRVADLFPQGSISTSTVRWPNESSFTNAATRVAEAAQKPAATLALTQSTATVEKTAVTVKVTSEMLEDWAFTQSYIDNALTYMVQALEDGQLLTGTGSSQITGLLNAGIQTTSAAAVVTPADAFHKAKTLVRDLGNVEPNYYIVNPYDFENLKITKDTNGQYHGGGPFTGPYGVGGYTNVETLWGLPAVITSAMTRGTAICGNFMVGAMIFRRTGLTVESTNSNDTDFEYNLISVRAEQRMTLATWKPLAFCEITGIPA